MRFVCDGCVFASMHCARRELSLSAREEGAHIVRAHARNACVRMRWYVRFIFSPSVRARSASHAYCLSCLMHLRFKSGRPLPHAHLISSLYVLGHVCIIWQGWELKLFDYSAKESCLTMQWTPLS